MAKHNKNEKKSLKLRGIEDIRRLDSRGILGVFTDKEILELQQELAKRAQQFMKKLKG